MNELSGYVFSPLREGDRLWKAWPRVAYGIDRRRLWRQHGY
jgi:hypothetical protein